MLPQSAWDSACRSFSKVWEIRMRALHMTGSLSVYKDSHVNTYGTYCTFAANLTACSANARSKSTKCTCGTSGRGKPSFSTLSLISACSRYATRETSSSSRASITSPTSEDSTCAQEADCSKHIAMAVQQAPFRRKELLPHALLDKGLKQRRSGRRTASAKTPSFSHCVSCFQQGHPPPTRVAKDTMWGNVTLDRPLKDPLSSAACVGSGSGCDNATNAHLTFMDTMPEAAARTVPPIFAVSP